MKVWMLAESFPGAYDEYTLGIYRTADEAKRQVSSPFLEEWRVYDLHGGTWGTTLGRVTFIVRPYELGDDDGGGAQEGLEEAVHPKGD